MQEKPNTALTPKRTSAVSRNPSADLDAQLELLRSLPARVQPADPIGFVCTNELIKSKGGQIVIRKRDNPLKIFSDDHGRAFAAAQSTHASRMGFEQGMRRGKYNDEGRLFFNDYGSATVGEVVSAASTF